MSLTRQNNNSKKNKILQKLFKENKTSPLLKTPKKGFHLVYKICHHRFLKCGALDSALGPSAMFYVEYKNLNIISSILFILSFLVMILLGTVSKHFDWKWNEIMSLKWMHQWCRHSNVSVGGLAKIQILNFFSAEEANKALYFIFFQLSLNTDRHLRENWTMQGLSYRTN